VRHPLVQRIVAAYEETEDQANTNHRRRKDDKR
jgi:phosphate starvation-inducible protein PhoH